MNRQRHHHVGWLTLSGPWLTIALVIASLVAMLLHAIGAFA